MSSGVFVLEKNGTLVEMNQQDFDSENRLQELIAKYPNLLAGSLIDEGAPRKWILISREFSIPDQEESEGRWSIDHLFLDQDGVPTLVEVKRSTDTRIRREVVGQMLEYAANAVSYWDIDKIRLHFESRCEKEREDPSQIWAERFQLEDSYKEYWFNVSTNLQTGRIRMLFVADEIPIELKQIIEFLNEQMNPAEVLGLEIKQYMNKDQSTLIPRIFGQSSKTQLRKSSSSRATKKWDEKSFFEELYRRKGQESVDIAKSILTWARENDLWIWWGEGEKMGSFFPMVEYQNKYYWLFAVWTYGSIAIQFQRMKDRPILGSEIERKNILKKLNEIPDVNLPEDSIDKRPSIPLITLSLKSSLKMFLTIWNKVIESFKK